MDSPLTPRLIRAVPPQLGTYLRPNRVDHKSLLAFLAEGTPSGLEGIVFDPALDSIHAELRDEARERKIEAVLDTRAMELALEGGYVGARRALPWAADHMHRCDDLRGTSGRDCIQRIVDSLIAHRGGGKAFTPQARIYVPALQTFLSQNRRTRSSRTARSAPTSRAKRAAARAVLMTCKPIRNFLSRRTGEISRLSALPDTFRASRYMEEILRPATDQMAKAVKVEPQLDKTRERLAVLRSVLGNILEDAQPLSFSAVPEGKRIQTRRGA